MELSISNQKKQQILDKLTKPNQDFNSIYKGDRELRQPIQTMYQGADLFRYDIIQSITNEAINTFKTYASDFIDFGKAFQLKGFEKLSYTDEQKQKLLNDFVKNNLSEEKQHQFNFVNQIYNKVEAKLRTESVEDYRIDFEDGFGNKTDAEEDQTAVFVGEELVKGMKAKTLPYFIGIRTKSFTEELKARSVRTIDLLLTTVLRKTNGQLPSNFVIMLPKVTIPEQVEALHEFLNLMEDEYNLPHNTIKMEMMVETTQAVMDSDGINPLYKFIKASKGRCHAMHFGTYDYTASCGITAAYQEMDHPVCDFAHHVTKVALAHTGIWLSDGATNSIPNGLHNGELTNQEFEENTKVVHAAWLKGYHNIRHSLWNGFYQGWDLYPSQLPMRYTAVYAFFLESYPSAVKRMKSFLDKSFNSSSNQFADTIAEDAATGQALLNFFLKAINSGAITIEEVTATGLSKAEIESRSFATILKNRMKD